MKVNRHHTSAILVEARAAHAELLKCVEEGRVFKLSPFLLARGRKSIKPVELAFRRLFGKSTKALFMSLRRPRALMRASSAAMVEHAAALKQAIDEAVTAGKPIAMGAFLAERGAHQDSARRAFVRINGFWPLAYYHGLLAARVGALRAERPNIPRCWLVVRTGASERVIDKVLARLGAEQAKTQEAA